MTQDHTWHSVSTIAYNRNCGSAVNTWFTQYQEYYKVQQWGAPGTYCGYQGWYQSPSGSKPYYDNLYNWDIWLYFPCNNGGGVNVLLTIDSWQYAWSDYYGWLGGARRPATSHCHCP